MKTLIKHRPLEVPQSSAATNHELLQTVNMQVKKTCQRKSASERERDRLPDRYDLDQTNMNTTLKPEHQENTLEI